MAYGVPGWPPPRRSGTRLARPAPLRPLRRARGPRDPGGGDPRTAGGGRSKPQRPRNRSGSRPPPHRSRPASHPQPHRSRPGHRQGSRPPPHRSPGPPPHHLRACHHPHACHRPPSTRPACSPPVVTAVVCIALAATTGARPELIAWLALTPVAVLLAVVDRRVHRLPDPLTLPLAAAAVLLLGGAALLPGAAGSWTSGLLGGLALGGFYFLLFLINPNGMGFGDVKLALALGVALGWYGWAVLFVGGFAGFLFGAAYGLGLVLLRGAGRKTGIPFGPFMITGTLVEPAAGRPGRVSPVRHSAQPRTSPSAAPHVTQYSPARHPGQPRTAVDAARTAAGTARTARNPFAPPFPA